MWEELILMLFKMAIIIYSSIKEEEVFIYWAYFDIFLWVRLRILWVGLIVIGNWIISQRNMVFGI